MSEKNAYKLLKKHLVLPCSDRIDRIETRIIQGVPDVNLCLDGGYEMWIEIKSPVEPKKQSTPLFGSNHKVSQEQKNWFHRQLASGGRGFFLIYTDKRIILLNGKFYDEINAMPLSEILDKADWHTTKPVRKNEWNKLREALKL
jgi:hypothetical protein